MSTPFASRWLDWTPDRPSFLKTPYYRTPKTPKT